MILPLTPPSGTPKNALTGTPNTIRPAFQAMPRPQQPQFGMDMATASLLAIPFVMLGSTLGTAISLTIKSIQWDKEVNQVKTAYEKAEDRDVFLNTLGNSKQLKQNPHLQSWHAFKLKAHRKAYIQATRQELFTLERTLITAEDPEKLIQDIKHSSRKKPGSYKNPEIVYAWAAHIEASHIISEARRKKVLDIDEMLTLHQAGDSMWRQTFIMDRGPLAEHYEKLTLEIDERMKRKRFEQLLNPQVLGKEFLGVAKQLERDTGIQALSNAITSEHEGVEWDEIEDLDWLDPTFDEDELRRRHNERMFRDFRQQLEGLSADDFKNK